jgi:AraC-like DNA-binding protein
MGSRRDPEMAQHTVANGFSLGPSVLAAAATGIVASIERQKGDVDRIFGHAGIAPDMAGLPTLQLSLDSFCRLFELSSRLTHNDNFGLWFGNQFEPRDLGLWGYAAVSASTLGSALETLVELFPLHQQSSTMNMARQSNGLVRLTYQIDMPQIVERRQDAELTLGNVLNVMREGLGQSWAAEEVHFEHPRPDGWRDHEKAFSSPVFFSQPTNAILFKPDVLSRPMPASDVRLLATMRQCLERLADRTDLRASVADRVRAVVRASLPDGVPILHDVSNELRLASTVIVKELNRDGVSYKELVESTRRELALSYLRQRQLPMSEIAFLLGYSELSAFSRAVRRWTGRSPRSVRQSLLETQD